MNTFLWTIVVILALSCVGKLGWLVSGIYPARKPTTEALDVIIQLFLIVWAAILLSA